MKTVRKTPPQLPPTRLADVFAQMMEIPKAQRSAFLIEREKEDPQLAAQIQEFGIKRKTLDSFLEGSFSPSDIHLTEETGGFAPKRLLGEGGFAKVYLAEDLSLGRTVALKVSLLKGREAKILALLDHDNIVKVHSVHDDEVNKLHIICMQYVDGVNLSDLIEHLAGFRIHPKMGRQIIRFLKGSATSALAQMDLQDFVLAIGIQMADALEFAHSKGILHLDVKPSNILLNREGRPFLTDFNVSLDSRTGAGPTGGTVDYMPPEQVAAIESPDGNSRVDRRTDIYSLGVVLIALACRAGTPERRYKFFGKILEAQHADVFKLVPTLHSTGIDFGLAQILKRCVLSDPTGRFQSAKELGEALKNFKKLRRIGRNLPQAGIFSELATALPFVSGLFFSFLPQALATLLIWRELGAMTKALPTFAIIQGIFLALIGLCLNNACQSRAKVFRFPEQFFLLMTLFWLPISLAMGATLLGPDISRQTLGILLVHLVSWGLATIGYSVLFTQTLLLKGVYPRFWFQGFHASAPASEEVSYLTRTLRVYFALPFLGPLLAVFDHGFPSMVPVFPISAAVAGLIFSLYWRNSLASLLHAYSIQSVSD